MCPYRVYTVVQQFQEKTMEKADNQLDSYQNSDSDPDYQSDNKN